MSVTEKTPIGTIDLTPTWREILPTLVLLLCNGDTKGHRTALRELNLMAEIADLFVRQEKEFKKRITRK